MFHVKHCAMTTTEDIARVCHEANRAWQHISGDPAPSPPWDEAPEDQRVSATAGVDAALRGVTPEELHEEWAKAKMLDGWTYGPMKDAAAKTHHCLVPYADLPKEQTAKDDLFLGVVRALKAQLDS